MEIIDFSYARPSINSIKSHGYVGVARYLSSSSSKRIGLAELQRYLDAGLSIILVWEDSAKAPLGGAVRGLSDARKANDQADALGWPKDRPIYYAVDFDVQLSQRDSVLNYLRAAASVTSRPVGVYGGYNMIGWAAQSGYRYLWQTAAWSGGRTHSQAMVYQYAGMGPISDTDVNRILVSKDWGQVPFTPAPVPSPTPSVIDLSNEEEDMRVMRVEGSGYYNVWGGPDGNVLAKGIPGPYEKAKPVLSGFGPVILCDDAKWFREYATVTTSATVIPVRLTKDEEADLRTHMA